MAEGKSRAKKDDLADSMILLLKTIKQQMREIWHDSQNFGVSNEVFMVEVEVIHRLISDGLLSFLQSGRFKGLTVESLIRFMRRDEKFRYQFASTVGKRMLSERIISRGRTSIIEHHRSVNWGEREYVALHRMVCDESSYMDRMIREGFKDGFQVHRLFKDNQSQEIQDEVGIELSTSKKPRCTY